jgi:hypothetical protein
MDIFGKRVSTLLLVDRPVAQRATPEPRPAPHAGVRDGLALARAALAMRTPLPASTDRKERYSNQASA